MEVFTMVVLIVAISCAAGVLNNYLKNQRIEREKGPGNGVVEQLEELRQRVAVLEEIVTDERYQLRKEFDQLERRPSAGPGSR